MSDIFVVILRYLVSLDIIDSHRGSHLEFLDKNYRNGIFVASGMQVPRNGGIILAKSETRAALMEILQNDPFYIHNLAEYQIFEFVPNKYVPEFEQLL